MDVVRASNKQEWKDIQDFMKNRRIDWRGITRYVEYMGSNNCIKVGGDWLTYAPLDYFKLRLNKFTIIDFKTFMKNIKEGKYGSNIC